MIHYPKWTVDTLDRAIVQNPEVAVRRQREEEGRGLCDRLTLRMWVYGRRLRCWCWILVQSKSGKRLGAARQETPNG